jgi:hypothetical protein
MKSTSRFIPFALLVVALLGVSALVGSPFGTSNTLLAGLRGIVTQLALAKLPGHRPRPRSLLQSPIAP